MATHFSHNPVHFSQYSDQVLDDQRIIAWFTIMHSSSSLSCPDQACGHTTLCLWHPKALYSWTQQVGHNTDQLPPPGARVMNAWNSTPTLPYAFKYCCLIKYRDFIPSLFLHLTLSTTLLNTVISATHWTELINYSVMFKRYIKHYIFDSGGN
jgi:hypothetical protein